jgi:hypothetical protein
MKRKKNGTGTEEGDRWAGVEVSDDAEDGNGMSTVIRFEISAERCGNDGYDDGGPASRMAGIVRAVTSEGARSALAAAIDLFLAKRMNDDDKK